MGRVKADAAGSDAGGMPAACIDGIEEIDAVMPFGAGEIEQERKVGLRIRAVAAEHVKRAPEIPVLLMAVPAPLGIGVRVMPWTAGVERAGAAPVTGRVGPAKGAGMDSHSGTVTGDNKASPGDKAKGTGRKEGSKIKGMLQDALGAVLEGFPGADTVYQVQGMERVFFRLNKLAIRPDLLLWLFAVFRGGEERGT